MGTWSTGYSWGFSSAYATGDFVFFNTNYSDPTFAKLVKDSETSPDAVTAMHSYDSYASLHLPVIWSVTTNFANEVSKNLRGVAFPPTGILQHFRLVLRQVSADGRIGRSARPAYGPAPGIGEGRGPAPEAGNWPG